MSFRCQVEDKRAQTTKVYYSIYSLFHYINKIKRQYATSFSIQIFLENCEGEILQYRSQFQTLKIFNLRNSTLFPPLGTFNISLDVTNIAISFT